jgi:hypothetical protein
VKEKEMIVRRGKLESILTWSFAFECKNGSDRQTKEEV